MTERWNFDLVHSNINFSVRHMMVARVRGRFSRWEGLVEFDEDAPASSRVEVQIDAASIDTWEDPRDAHLRSPDFLDVEKYPTIALRSTAVEPAGERRFRLLADLTMCGVTRPLVVDVEYGGRVKDLHGGERIGFVGRTSIQRKDYGLTWNQVLEAGGVMISDRIDVDVEIEAVKKP